MWLALIFIIAFIAGFLTLWLLFDDIGTDVLFFVDDEELQEMHWQGLGNRRFQK